MNASQHTQAALTYLTMPITLLQALVQIVQEELENSSESKSVVLGVLARLVYRHAKDTKR